MDRLSYPKNKINILLLENIHPDAKDFLVNAGFNVEVENKSLTEEELKERIKGVHILGIRSKTQITKEIIEDRDIDSSRMVVMPVTTVQEFRHQALTVLDKYIEQKKSERKPILLVLDSLGMLSTTKEMEDTQAGKETKDMTRAQIVKAAFRVLT